MRDGLYKVDFRTPIDMGSGVVMLRGGRLHGGDSTMFYVGTYSETGSEFKATVQAAMHTAVPGVQSVFGTDHVTIHLAGVSDGDTASMGGKADEAPGAPFQATLSWICD